MVQRIQIKLTGDLCMKGRKTKKIMWYGSCSSTKASTLACWPGGLWVRISLEVEFLSNWPGLPRHPSLKWVQSKLHKAEVKIIFNKYNNHIYIILMHTRDMVSFAYFQCPNDTLSVVSWTPIHHFWQMVQDLMLLCWLWSLVLWATSAGLPLPCPTLIFPVITMFPYAYLLILLYDQRTTLMSLF